MEKLNKVFNALDRLGSLWAARRLSKKFLFDTIECVTLVHTKEGVIRGFVEVQRLTNLCRTKVEVVCFIDGYLDENGEFKHLKHPKIKTVKLYEYNNEVLYKYSKFFGIGLGWNPIGAVPGEHQFLTDFADQRIIIFENNKKADEAKKTSSNEVESQNNKEIARRALFG